MRSSRQIQAGGKLTSSHLWTSWVTLPGCWGYGFCYALCLLYKLLRWCLQQKISCASCHLRAYFALCLLSPETSSHLSQCDLFWWGQTVWRVSSCSPKRPLKRTPTSETLSYSSLLFLLKKNFWLNYLVQIIDCFSGQSFFYFPIIVQTWRQHLCVQCPVAAHWILRKTHNVLMHLHKNNSSLRGK